MARAYDNGAPRSRLPPLGWSSWVALGPGADTDAAAAPVRDFCDEASVRMSIDAFFEVGLYDAGYRHFHLDDPIEVGSTGVGNGAGVGGEVGVDGWWCGI